MTKFSVSLAGLMLMAACSAAASPNVAAQQAVAPAPAEVNAVASERTAPVQSVAPSAAMHSAQRASVPVTHGTAMDDAVSCDLRVRSTTNGVQIQAVARAESAFDGEYQLVITRSGRDGSADVTSGGPVSVAAGEAMTLSSTELSVDGRFHAVLTLSGASGEVCRQELRS